MSLWTSRISSNGRETVPDVREWSGGPCECMLVVGRPSRKSGSGRETLSDVRDCLGDPTGCPGVVGRPSRMSGSDTGDNPGCPG